MSSFNKVYGAIIILLVGAGVSFGVTSKVVRQSTFAELTAKGADSENVIVTSDGKITLSKDIETLVDDINDVWVINSIAIDSKENVYLGTSPDGDIYVYKNGKLEKFFEPESEKEAPAPPAAEPNDPNQVVDANEVKTKIANKHIFAMRIDSKDNLIAGVSGERAQLIKFKGKKADVVFDSNEAKYIFAIEADVSGNTYIGTGPEGIVYRVDKDNKTEIIYDSDDKNILSLVLGEDNTLYAGADKRGLVYKVDLSTKTASVVYDSAQQEITAVATDGEGNLYAAATSEDVAANQAQNRPQANIVSLPGRIQSSERSSASSDDGGMKLQIANTKTETDPQHQSRKLQANQPKNEGPASHIYKIDKEGFVTDIYSKVAMFFDIAIKDGSLIIASGNDGQLFYYDIDDEEDSLLYQDKVASQVLAIAAFEDDIYIATGNPAKLLKVKNTFSETGYFISSVIDAGQVARWGKLQIDASIPAGAAIKMQARTANISEPNDSQFSNWTDAVNINGPVELGVSKGRFCQYKLILETTKDLKTPVISETSVAYVIPNIAPKVVATQVSREKDKAGAFSVKYNAVDENEDKLTYKIELKKVGRENWIEIEKDFDKNEYQWDSRTVEDGRYEFRITASDTKSNDEATKLAGTRISDVFVVDNTAAEIDIKSVERTQSGLVINMAVSDGLSMIGSIEYTVNSSKDYKSALPVDSVYDTTEEQFRIAIEDIEPGVYLISFKVSDDIGNTRYKSVEVIAD